MRHVAITLATAAALVGLFLLLRSLGAGDERAPALPELPDRPEAPDSRPPSPVAPIGDPAVVAGLSELEALHVRHGAFGAAMKGFLAMTVGRHWNQVDRTKMQEYMHAAKHGMKEEDVPYLLDLFNRTPDPAFRWWFSWLAQQAPDPRFVEPLTEVYRIDPNRAIQAMAVISGPAARDRYLKLFEAEADPKVREHAVVALSHTDWPDREDVITGIARDQQRAGGERLEAMGALGRTGSTPESLALLMDVALGPKQPVTGLSEANAKAHPVADLRSGAVLAVMTRGDQEAARRLMEAADAPGADPDLSRIVDTQIAHFRGPDISEFIYDRARRRGFLSAGEVRHLVRDPERVDRARLRDALPLIRDPETKALAEKLASGG